ncbi:MAG: homocysteine S-methyltransferase family protein [candidate division NC10 bacterium]|nr:homocysteine S-methyltransferase family protein [candidate division NC10 bacterium]
MSRFLDRLALGPIVSSGAIGTLIQDRGLPSGETSELWNLRQPEEVAAIYHSFWEAGAELIGTNTFGANRIKLARFGLQDQAYDLNLKGAQIARRNLPDSCLIFGSAGPTGELLAPLGPLSREEVYAAFREQSLALAEGGVDVLCFRTMSDLEEIRIAISSAKENTHLPVIATMSFSLGQRGYRTMMGVDPEAAVQGLRLAGADVIGSNCGQGIEEMAGLMAEMRRLDSGYLAAQPNAGKPQLIEGKSVYAQAPREFASRVPDLLQLGINLMGGCCGVGPEHIREVAAVVRRTGCAH